MVFQLDDIDIAILESLVKDGRKSFRQISRETKFSTPTVKVRYERLVNMGVLKSVSPIFDMKKLKIVSNFDTAKVNNANHRTHEIGRRVSIKIPCDYCKGKIHEKPSVLKFANMQRFFCCSSCRTLYREKYKQRIENLMKTLK
ncbi:MAG: AsnC family transcriptional regulator [Nitrosopumilaceae archaeon]